MDSCTGYILLTLQITNQEAAGALPVQAMDSPLYKSQSNWGAS